jgi:antitoxin ParD1/3/4
MNISLSPELRKYVAEKVSSGQYHSPADVVAAALLLMKDEESLTAEEIEELRKEIAIGIEQADRGEFVEFTAKDIQAEGRRILRSQKKVG